MIPVGTKVIWEEYPHGITYPSVLHEGRVVDPQKIEYRNTFRVSIAYNISHLVYVTESPNAIVYSDQCRLLPISKLVY